MVIPAFIMNIADAGKRLLRNKGLLFRFRCSQQFSAHRRRVLLSSVGCFFGSYVFCFVWYLPCKSFHPKIKSVEGM